MTNWMCSDQRAYQFALILICTEVNSQQLLKYVDRTAMFVHQLGCLGATECLVSLSERGFGRPEMHVDVPKCDFDRYVQIQ